MQEIAIRLVAEAEGSVAVAGAIGGSARKHWAAAGQVRGVQSSAAVLMGGFQSGHLAFPVHACRNVLAPHEICSRQIAFAGWPD